MHPQLRQRVRLGGAIVSVLVATLLTGCGSASTPAPAGSPALDPATPIDYLDVDSCALLTPAGAETVTGVPMTAGVLPNTPIATVDLALCEYLPTAEPTTSATIVSFSAQRQAETPVGTDDAALAFVAPVCDRTTAPPTPGSGGAGTCTYQPIEVAGGLPGFVLYPGPSKDGSDPEPTDNSGIQLSWFAGGLAFMIMTTADVATAVDAIRVLADQIAHALA